MYPPPLPNSTQLKKSSLENTARSSIVAHCNKPPTSIVTVPSVSIFKKSLEQLQRIEVKHSTTWIFTPYTPFTSLTRLVMVYALRLKIIINASWVPISLFVRTNHIIQGLYLRQRGFDKSTLYYSPKKLKMFLFLFSERNSRVFVTFARPTPMKIKVGREENTRNSHNFAPFVISAFCCQSWKKHKAITCVTLQPHFLRFYF